MSRIRVIIRLKRRLALALLLSSLAINGAVAGSNLSRCLDPATTLDAGVVKEGLVVASPSQFIGRRPNLLSGLWLT
jgi:hypothetical protein